MLRHFLFLAAVLGFAASASAVDVDKYLLDDTDAVLGINVKLLMQSPLAKKHYLPLAKKQLQANAELQKQFRELGFDPFRDVDRILIVHGDSCHRTVDGKEEFAPLVIVRGRFDPTKIYNKVTQFAQLLPNLVKVHKTKNGLIYEIAQPKRFFFAVPDRTALVGAAFKDQMEDALAIGRNRKTRKLKHFGMDFLIGQADNQHGLWAVAQGRAAFGDKSPFPTAKGKKVEKDARKKLSDSGIEELSGGVTVADGLRAKFHIKVPDPETAKTISDVLAQVLPQFGANDFDGKLEGKKLDPVRALLRSLVVANDDNYLIVQGEVPGKVFVESLK